MPSPVFVRPNIHIPHFPLGPRLLCNVPCCRVNCNDQEENACSNKTPSHSVPGNGSGVSVINRVMRFFRQNLHPSTDKFFDQFYDSYLAYTVHNLLIHVITYDLFHEIRSHPRSRGQNPQSMTKGRARSTCNARAMY